MLKLATAGGSFLDIKQKMEADGFKLAEIETGFDVVVEYYRALAEFNPRIEMGKAVARLNMLFLSSLKIQDYKTSLAVQKDLNKLLGLYDRSNPAAADVIDLDEIRSALDDK